MLLAPQHEDRGVQLERTSYGGATGASGQTERIRITDALGRPAAIENHWGSGK